MIIKCKNCNKEIRLNPKSAIRRKTCSLQCKKEIQIKKRIKICLYCRNKFKADGQYNKKRKFCSPQCAGLAYKGNKSPKWKGGRIIEGKGYVSVTIPLNHPLKLKGKRYIAEHRLIMEKHTGRFLKSSEFVHHLNGDKKDNRVENLALCTLQNHFDFIKKLQERIRELEDRIKY